MKVLITGSNGQLGKALISKKPKDVELIEVTRDILDLENKKDCHDLIVKYKPDWVINCAAYTLVDKAESNHQRAFAINHLAPKEFAKALLNIGGNLMQISTDFVFNGEQNFPYKPEQLPSPINTYGESKAAGESSIEDLLGKTKQSLIIRTSWLMGPVGNNFALTILKLLKEKKVISVINDQIGAPTSTLSLSRICWKAINLYSKNNIDLPKILHWTDSGVASWYDIAIAISEISQELGLIKNCAKIIPIPSSEYKSIAKRPRFSILDSSRTNELLKIPSTHWRESLLELIKETAS